MKYRHKPVTIEAVQFLDDTFEDCIRFLGSSAMLNIRERAIIVLSPLGHVEASITDWIIRDERGEFYVIEPESFASSYEPAEKQDGPQMARLKSIPLLCAQWWKNGDHPLDYAEETHGYEHGELRTFTGEERKANGWEGGIVRYFRRPDVSGDSLCPHCGKKMNDHGWMEGVELSRTVCPGNWLLVTPERNFTMVLTQQEFETSWEIVPETADVLVPSEMNRAHIELMGSMTQTTDAVLRKLETCNALLQEAAAALGEQEIAVAGNWWKRFFLYDGTHMILTGEGWESGSGKAEYERHAEMEGIPLTDIIKDEVNAPGSGPIPYPQPTEAAKHVSMEKGPFTMPEGADIPFKPVPPNTGPGTLEIGDDGKGMVVVNLPRDMTGHIIFSPSQARRLASLLQTRAEIAAKTTSDDIPFHPPGPNDDPDGIGAAAREERPELYATDAGQQLEQQQIAHALNKAE